MKKFLWVLAFIIIVVVLVASYFGLFPGISDVLGANKAKDLGVRYTDSDLQTGRQQTGVSLEDQTGDKSLGFSGQKDISATYSSQVITAMINSAKYKYYPLTNTQIRINDDGSVEASGNFNIDKAFKWSEDLGGASSLSDEAKKYTKFISNNPGFYLKGKMSIVDNKINLNISEAKISRFSATASIIDQYQGELASFVEDRIAAVPGMKVKSANFENGSLKLDATYPAVEKSLK